MSSRRELKANGGQQRECNVIKDKSWLSKGNKATRHIFGKLRLIDEFSIMGRTQIEITYSWRFFFSPTVLANCLFRRFFVVVVFNLKYQGKKISFISLLESCF